MNSAKQVLIVEDDKPLSHALELKLSKEGMSVTVANDGQEALDQLNAQQFDVMLLDVMMPLMGGFQVLEQVNKMTSAPIVFALTNLSTEEDQKRVMALGAKKYFIKSNTPLSEIVEEIKQA